MGKIENLPLFVTKLAKGRILFHLYALLLFLVVRWNPIYRYTFKDRLSHRYEKALPGVDIFVCTADPMIEPPVMVINTVLSVMAYDYPPEKLSVYLSDDGGSDLTFYAMLEASRFSKIWLPFCKKFKVEPRCPEAYFHTAVEPQEPVMSKEWSTVKILIDGRDPKAVDIEGQPLPTLVYLAREKRPQYHHHFKAGAMNALVEMAGFDGNGGPCYIGTGCFHRRETLCGLKHSEDYKPDWKRWNNREVDGSTSVQEETCKVLASCSYEENTQWGKEYGCLVEDVITGLAIQCRGWRSIYFNPERKGFLGVAPTTLLQSLIQHKRWSEGDFQIFASSHCPFLIGYKKIPLKLQIAYCVYLLWAPNCLATLYYVTVPSLCLLRGISLFPEISNLWILPFAFVIILHRAYSLGEFVWFGGTFLGFTKSGFVITTKVAEDDVSQRYEQEVMEFGTSSTMFTILSTLALLNAFCFVGGLKRVIADVETLVWERFTLQILLCGLIVLINLPVYQGLFFRKDVASLPTSLTYRSTIFALLACAIALY
uniref:Glycosyltransferase 2-like domain-containing protein n=1 Tax=Fagus sylvatica TaxID=28930 RepID=A0A2N9GQN2_FAGSY